MTKSPNFNSLKDKQNQKNKLNPAANIRLFQIIEVLKHSINK